MANTALNRTVALLLTNGSGGSVAFGDCVVLSTSADNTFTTTAVLGYTTSACGVVLEPNGIASGAVGMVAFGGYVSQINTSAAGTQGDLIRMSGTVKIGVRHAWPSLLGDFAIALDDADDPPALLFNTLPSQIAADSLIAIHVSLPIAIPRR